MVEVYQRRRSEWFNLANDDVKRIPDLNNLDSRDFERIQTYFDRWQEKYNIGKYIVLSKDNEYLFFRGVTRFQKIYKRKLWSKMQELVSVRFQHHFILEVNPHKHMLYYNEWSYMGHCWARFRSWLMKKYCTEKVNNKTVYVRKLDFVKIVELHESNRPHYHILVRIKGVKRIDYQECKRFWWKKYGVGYFKARAVSKGFKPLWYLLKYVNKSCVGSKTFSRVVSSIFFSTNKRLFSVSRSLFARKRSEPKKDDEDKYVLFGSKLSSVVNLYVVSKGLKQDELFYRIIADTKDFYEFPELFYVNIDKRDKK